ncbi:RlpA-like double-psi beta-barrel-protein domain-containing protein-containing protein [Boeremia exigua]|uniref:RlpA-like double-psi beta-barrel-protein domain-containing protein-containing protein n=1 Tax=Boeremia exigua TaxID=749465 RepID=UPI001E8E4506|nr:RlpA-like double-psi beta-barrel-protein domain-containing protein-containing protein [Boeremia exigua]KAH6611910.1 RlpA-like double-psi beta-barrel-protein domain-containing protein-containing protein [Boeremia exigua]
MSAPAIPRKEIARKELPNREIEGLAPAHFKERGASDTSATWNVPGEGPSKKRRIHLGAGAGWAVTDRFDRVLPPHKRYFGRSRRTFLIALLVTFVCLLALIIGLAVGLSKKPENRFLPLPSNADHFTGELTYYGPGLGACGVESTEEEAIVSVSHFLYDAVQTGSDPNQNPLCGKKIRATRVDERTGKQVSIDLTVVDRCTGCEPTDLDVSPAMFDRMADHDLGRVVMTWAWLS